MGPELFVTHDQLNDRLAAAIQEVKEEIVETEQRLRSEWTETVRYEVGRVDTHLGEQDKKINWTLGLIVTLLVVVIGSLILLVH